MNKKFVLALSLLALPSTLAAEAPTPAEGDKTENVTKETANALISAAMLCPLEAAGDMVTYGLITHKASTLSWVKKYPRAKTLLAAFSAATFLYGPASKNWGWAAWKKAKANGPLSEAAVDAAFSAAAMTTLSLLTVKTGIKFYKGTK